MPSILPHDNEMIYTNLSSSNIQNDLDSNILYKNSNHNIQRTNNSLIESTSKFIDAINYMKDTIMLPSRLKDIPNNITPSLIISENMNGNPTSESKESFRKNNVKEMNKDPSLTLYSNFLLLNEISKELKLLPGSDESNALQDFSNGFLSEQDLYAYQASLIFRKQLKTILESLEKLTDSAYYLAQKYQENIGDQSECMLPTSRRKCSLKSLF
ncbi:unnamed protein product [Gordionus sp. m RMFG-2023]|uniref:mid1-interacting protein 1-like n=1 Tax=Gordionus sp. m RMFG-2023 TaxID=3053472 RepID=UPI0030E1F5A7